MNKVKHDAAYKAIFSHPEAVKSLLQEFIPDDFVSHFDFSTLKKCPADYISEGLRERLGDCVWQVQWKGQNCYVIIMLEFQRRELRWMPLRILIYTGLLWHDLITSQQIKAGDLLPPVFPIVLYNGSRPWRGPPELRQMIRQIHPVLDVMQPNIMFRLVDEQRIPRTVLDQATGLAAEVFRIEQAKEPGDIFNILLKMYRNSALAAQDSLLASFTEWVCEIIQNIDPGWKPSEENGMALMEMIRNAVASYVEQGREEGRKEGRKEGREEGRKEGHKEGRKEGRKEGHKEGRKEGRQEGEACANANLRGELLKHMAARFGSYPRSWEDLLNKVNDTCAIGRLLGLLYQVPSAAEYEPLLKAAANGGK